MVAYFRVVADDHAMFSTRCQSAPFLSRPAPAAARYAGDLVNSRCAEPCARIVGSAFRWGLNRDTFAAAPRSPSPRPCGGGPRGRAREAMAQPRPLHPPLPLQGRAGVGAGRRRQRHPSFADPHPRPLPTWGRGAEWRFSSMRPCLGSADRRRVRLRTDGLAGTSTGPIRPAIEAALGLPAGRPDQRRAADAARNLGHRDRRQSRRSAGRFHRLCLRNQWWTAVDSAARME